VKHLRSFAGSAAITAVACATITVAGAARAQCAADHECKGDRICAAGRCLAPLGVGCAKDVDCPGDLVCSDGYCADAATAATPDPGADIVAAQAPSPAAPVPVAVTTGGAPLELASEAAPREPIVGLLIAGPVVWGVTWLATIAATVPLSDTDGEAIGYSAVPLAGPWIMIGALDTAPYTPALAVSGLLQAGGLTMTILGAAIRRDVEPREAAASALPFDVSPLVSADTTGAVIRGGF
jgi:hypothetical protein